MELVSNHIKLSSIYILYVLVLALQNQEVDLPRHQTNIGVKWVFKTKLNETGEIEKHMERLVAKGLSQYFGVYYGETFALVARLNTFKTILSTKDHTKWKVYQFDVKSAFLNGILQEEVYVE